MVTPSKTGYTFMPHQSYSNVTANQSGQDYTATLNTYTISRQCRGGRRNPDLHRRLDHRRWQRNYSFTVTYGWSGTVTPSKTGYTFTPTNRTIPTLHPTRPDKITLPALNTYTISGNAGVAGATLTYTGGSATATADGSGNYSFTVPSNWSGTVTPSLAGYAFTPVNIIYTNVITNQS